MVPEKNNQTRACIVVSGKVQGVYFRAHTQTAARQFKLTGWVKNCKNGKVEALLEGSQSDIETVIEICRKGPPASCVTGIEIKWKKATNEFDSFNINLK